MIIKKKSLSSHKRHRNTTDYSYPSNTHSSIPYDHMRTQGHEESLSVDTPEILDANHPIPHTTSPMSTPSSSQLAKRSMAYQSAARSSTTHQMTPYHNQSSMSSYQSQSNIQQRQTSMSSYQSQSSVSSYQSQSSMNQSSLNFPFMDQAVHMTVSRQTVVYDGQYTHVEAEQQSYADGTWTRTHAEGTWQGDRTQQAIHGLTRKLTRK